MFKAIQTADKNHILDEFRAIVGVRHVLVDQHATKPYRTGYRAGIGDCLAVLRPGSLNELWRTLQSCIRRDIIVIMQAANTGLTSGSTPSNGYDRDVVVISTRRVSTIHYIENYQQVVCLPGSTLHQLEMMLRSRRREPHSVIGSSCLGASVVGGVCNNSGGALVERGPSYTELSLFAQLNADGELELVNNLGIDLGATAEEIIKRLEAGDFDQRDIKGGDSLASDREYADWVRDVDAETPARYNADPRRLKDASGCAGKVAVFAVRLDTFPSNSREQTFFIGTKEVDVLTQLRRDVLRGFSSLPVSAEYLHRDMFTLTERYGRDTVHLIRLLGTSVLPAFFTMKERLNSRLSEMPFLPDNLIDRVLQGLSRLTPNPLPNPIRRIGHEFEHQLILKMKDNGIEEAAALLEGLEEEGKLTVHRCSPKESKLVSLHRYAAAGAAIRYQIVQGRKVKALLALDVALRRNDKDWFEALPLEIESRIHKKLYYGHFMCHVFHQDYILEKGADPDDVKNGMLKRLEERGAKYPAEHNVGHFYTAEQSLIDHYRSLDPTNSFNPGIGRQSKRKGYADASR